jgi:hypothetical protein
MTNAEGKNPSDQAFVIPPFVIRHFRELLQIKKE